MAVLAIFLTSSAVILAQNKDAAFHVTLIKAESRNNLVRLTWRDSSEARGPVYIYRSARPFSGSIPGNIRPIVVKYGTQYYIDDIEDMNSVFYYIAASDISGRIYEIIMYQVNSISLNLAEDPAREDSSQMAFVYEPGRNLSPGVTNLMTRRDGDRVVITFITSNPEKNVILYRSARPIRQPRDLLDSVITRTGNASPFVDIPVSGQIWYYAVVYEDDISSGNVIITPGTNATSSAVIIYNETASENFIRPMPLPFLTLDNYASGGFLADKPGTAAPLSAQSMNALNLSMSDVKVPLELKTPRVFAVDLEDPASGEESELFFIVNEYFQNREWDNARDSLANYLSLPRSKAAETRGRFYLGQAYYFTENYREALWEFLSFKNSNPEEANSWINAVLKAMVH